MARRLVSGDELVPVELLIDILTRLPVEVVGWCKCVCRSWQSAIASQFFQETYRNHHRCLIVCRLEDLKLRFYYSPIRRNSTEKFRRLPRELPWRVEPNGPSIERYTKLVNGLICYKRSKSQWTIQNVSTGEAILIPKPLHDNDGSSADYKPRIGYDPASRTYKLLMRLEGYSGGIEASIMTLGPKLEWRKVSDYDERMLLDNVEVKTFSGDGVLCWKMKDPPYRKVDSDSERLCLFDLSREKFKCVKIPAGVLLKNLIFVRARFHKVPQRLALSIWVKEGDDVDPERMECFVLEDAVGEEWRRRTSVALPEIEFHRRLGLRSVSSGSPFPGGGGRGGGDEMMLADIPSGVVYSYSTDKMPERLCIGKLPPSGFEWEVSCLTDINDLHRPLHDVLSGRS